MTGDTADQDLASLLQFLPSNSLDTTAGNIPMT